MVEIFVDKFHVLRNKFEVFEYNHNVPDAMTYMLPNSLNVTQGPYSSTILRLFLTWVLSFSQTFTNLDQNGIHQYSQF